MPRFTDTATGFFIGDTDAIPLSGSLPSPAEVEKAFSPLILSASGWRKVFARSGDEEDANADIGDANRVIAAHMADVFASYVLNRAAETGSAGAKPALALGLDTRPTGADIADVMCRVFIARGIDVHHVFIASAPEIMAFARGIGAFAYISASHNPIAHNGVKFGLADGGVLPGTEVAPLIDALRAACASPDAARRASQLISACPKAKLDAVYASITAEKAKSLNAYRSFTREVLSGESGSAKQDDFFRIIETAVAEQKAKGTPVSLAVDFNGSARTVSIDRAFFESCGIALSGMNEKPRQIAHRIVPEGESLSYCAREIERLRSQGTSKAERNAALGYVPDCDGDRGNIVFWNERTKRAEILEAQEVFALSVIAEFTHLVYLGKTSVTPGKKAKPPVAIAVNDPTSMRVEAIAEAFGATVARAEVGEANVVNLARRLRDEGNIVRILGEGSNGGNITHPAAVRDPLNTVFALLKMLVITDTSERPGLFHIWCSLSGQESKYRDGFTLADIMETLPPFATTSVFEKDAMLKVTTTDHAVLKRSFQKVFLREWDIKKSILRANYGFESWIAIANNGMNQTEGLSDFGASGKGGLKILFRDSGGKPAAYIWMRGSGTEPVFRILADARGGDVRTERYLLGWLTEMVLEADRKI
jgi:phosphoglucomutase